MKWGTLFVAALTLCFAACRTTSTADYDIESRAEYHMRMADSLETASSLREAALEYKLVAELYPKTSQYPNAVRNTALLYSNPSNPEIDDSLALQWFRTYLTLPIPRKERVKAEIYVAMLKRLTVLRNDINRRSAIIDSLQTVTRKQPIDFTGRSKRIQELEWELKQTKDELERLREVDIRINKRKGGK